ncbi:hypothetical protein ACPDPP_003769, partial [Vibrio cholerae]
ATVSQGYSFECVISAFESNPRRTVYVIKKEDSLQFAKYNPPTSWWSGSEFIDYNGGSRRSVLTCWPFLNTNKCPTTHPFLTPSGLCSDTEPPQCNADQILNPETNTCDARCTAPDVWDPV